MFAFFVWEEVEEIKIPFMFEENQQRRRSVFLPDAMGTLLLLYSPSEIIVNMDSSYLETTECDSFVTVTTSNVDIL